MAASEAALAAKYGSDRRTGQDVPIAAAFWSDLKA
jgi:hypothetical protein